LRDSKVVAKGGIVPPTRRFSVTNWFPQHQLHQPVSWGRPLQRMPHDAGLCRTDSRKTPAWILCWARVHTCAPV